MAEIKKVLKITGRKKENTRSFFTVKYNNEEYQLQMFPFQVKQEKTDPAEFDSLPCLIKTDENSTRVIQDIAFIVPRLYKVGKEYPFRIKSANPSFCTVRDSNGLTFRITDTSNSSFLEGQSVTCRVLTIDGQKMTLKYIRPIRAKKAVPFNTFESLASHLNLEEETAATFRNMVTTFDCFKTVKQLYDMEDGTWMLDCAIKLDNLLLGNEEERSVHDAGIIDLFERLCLYILEESNLLRAMSDDERQTWISRLCVIAEHAEDYKKAYEIMKANGAKEYIDSQFKNLRQSENLYRPERKFRIIMCLFNLNEELMGEMMDEFLEIILGGDKSHWSSEPFRTAFVDMLDMFICEYRSRAVRTSDASLIHMLIRAIAIQQLLSNENDNVDRRLNRSTFLRLLAYVQRGASSELLERSFNALFRPYPQKLDYLWEHVSDLNSLYYYVAYGSTGTDSTESERQIYRGGDGVNFLVDGSRVRVAATGATWSVNPGQLLPWRNISIGTIGEPPAVPRNPRVKHAAEFWRGVEKALHETPGKGRVKATPEVGDRVKVKVTNQSEDYSSLYCEIADDHYTGKGWLDVKQIVKYLKGDAKTINAFRAKDGSELLFEVEVIGEADSDEMLEFSMLPVIDEYHRSITEAGDIVTCSVREYNDQWDDSPFFLGYTDTGISCRIRCAEGVSISTRDTVKARALEFSDTGQLICVLEERVSAYLNPFNVFCKLMANLAEEPSVEEDMEMVESEIGPESFAEIIGVLDRRSVLSEDRVRAYGFLAMARIMALMNGNAKLAEYYAHRLEIIAAFEDYEINGYSADSRCAKLLEEIGSVSVSNDYILNEAVTKFRILDALKHKDKLDDLLQIRKETVNPVIRDTADLAVALVLTERFEVPNLSRQLTDRINAQLGVTVRKSKLKDYGLESQMMEFKSSIVYPAGNHMQPDREMQKAVILQVISGFLNSDKGGKLYIGVNKNGAASGVAADLAFLNMDEDAYGRHINQMVISELGQTAGSCITQRQWEEDGGYRIYILTIEPSPELVTFRGNVWIRQDTETRRLRKEEIAIFGERHRKAYNTFHNTKAH